MSTTHFVFSSISAEREVRRGEVFWAESVKLLVKRDRLRTGLQVRLQALHSEPKARKLRKEIPNFVINVAQTRDTRGCGDKRIVDDTYLFGSWAELSLRLLP